MAIVERIISTSFFPITFDYDFESFRSTALLGHPLNNALITSFLTLFFILISESTSKKFIYFSVGVLAIFAFGGRASLATVLVAFPFILFSDLNSYSSKIAINKFFSYLVIFILAFLFDFYIFSNTSFGERISNGFRFEDEGAEVRSRVFDLFEHFSFSQLLLGISQEEIVRVMYLEQVEIIENFWIIWIFKYGIILTVILGFFLLLFFLRLFKPLPLITRFILTLSFFWLLPEIIH